MVTKAREAAHPVMVIRSNRRRGTEPWDGEDQEGVVLVGVVRAEGSLQAGAVEGGVDSIGVVAVGAAVAGGVVLAEVEGPLVFATSF